jgi:hypothetical protein
LASKGFGSHLQSCAEEHDALSSGQLIYIAPRPHLHARRARAPRYGYLGDVRDDAAKAKLTLELGRDTQRGTRVARAVDAANN